MCYTLAVIQPKCDINGSVRENEVFFHTITPPTITEKTNSDNRVTFDEKDDIQGPSKDCTYKQQKQTTATTSNTIF